ncbi:MAG: hypothetical protein AABX48_02565 [Nanoarchaeota archaeon]
MKKRFLVLFVFVFSVLFISFFVNADTASNLNNNLDNINNQINNANNQINNIQNTKWDYLGQEWQKILLRNSVIAAADGFFKKINVVFLILFGIPYEMSLVLLAVFFVWLIFWNWSYKLIKSWGIVGESLWPYVASLVFVVVLAQLKIIFNLVLFLGNLIFAPSNAWTRTLIFCAVVFGFLIFQYLTYLYSKFLRSRKEAIQKKATEIAQKSIQKFSEKFRKNSRSG